jgi:uncharacterized protein (DUF488 family)
MSDNWEPMIYTIGHSTLPIDELVETLKTYDVARVVDVRSIPGSRHNPQFNEDALRRELERAGIEYSHMPGLGGFRKPLKDSPNAGWKKSAFRGYADYMQTEQFEENLDALIELARGLTVAIMCAEAVPWRCHRSLIADALTARGFEVVDILSRSSARPHQMTPFAVIEGKRVLYPG